jgi:hypothetical protein
LAHRQIQNYKIHEDGRLTVFVCRYVGFPHLISSEEQFPAVNHVGKSVINYVPHSILGKARQMDSEVGTSLVRILQLGRAQCERARVLGGRDLVKEHMCPLLTTAELKGTEARRSCL